MATFGQGVNASLGKTDYSNYLAGALQGARGVAAGGQAMGQGIANLGKSIGQGIEKYQQNKVLQAEIMGGVEENADWLVKYKPEAIADAPKAAQEIFARLENGKGVSLKDAAFMKSWSDSAVKRSKLEIENNAFASAIALKADGTAPTGQQAAVRYFSSGGTDKSLLGGLLQFGNNPLEVKALQKRIEGQTLANEQTEQVIKGTTPLTEREKQDLAIKRDEAAARQQAATAAAQRQAEADKRAEDAASYARDANARAQAAATASAAGATEKARVERLSNEAISIFNQGEEQFNAFFNNLNPIDQGVVLSEVNQFKRGISDEETLSPAAIANIMMKKDGKKGPTFGEYLSELRQASEKITNRTGDKYVVKGWFNDIDKIPAFEELIRQFPQFNVLPDEDKKTDKDKETIKLPSGGTVNFLGGQ